MSRRPMGSLEAAVLDVLWSIDDPLKPGDVLDRLDIDPPVAYSTVLTILRRLWKKRLVTRTKVGKAYLYRPTRSREEQVADAMAEAFAAATDPSVALGHFVEHLSPDQTTALKRLLGRRR
ncbi:MAG: penicillinase repressor [Acidimicrobiales bacterium]|nr:MAG: penicillinase repressor [Acidimicrobiales bacterium]